MKVVLICTTPSDHVFVSAVWLSVNTWAGSPSGTAGLCCLVPAPMAVGSARETLADFIGYNAAAPSRCPLWASHLLHQLVGCQAWGIKFVLKGYTVQLGNL